MKLLTQNVTSEQVTIAPMCCVPAIHNIKCDCCKHIESARVAKNWFVTYSNNQGWRQLNSPHFEFDSVCPSCVKELREFYQSKQASA